MLEVDGVPVTITECEFTAEPRASDDCETAIGFGYALTVHKAQGSEWPNVLIIDEYRRRLDGDRPGWLYTAITRASESVLVAFQP